MKNILKLLILITSLNIGAQGKPEKFNLGLIVPNATEVSTADSIPVLDGNLKLNTWISAANLVSGLEAISENGIGWRLIGRDPLNYGQIGNRAVDFGFSPAPSSTYGATGADSFNTGLQGTSSGVFSFNSAVDGTSSGNYSFNSATFSTAFSLSETNVGVYSTNYTPVSTTSFELLDRIFNVGNGDAGVRSNAFTILKNGKTGIGFNNFETTSDSELLQVNGEVKATNFVGNLNGFSDQVRGTGTTNYLAKFTTSGTIGDSQIFDDGTNIRIGTAATKQISIGTTDTHTLNSSIFKKITADPSTGGELAINVSLLERTANPTGSGYFYGSNNTITRSGTDAETGTKGIFTTVKKTGNFNSLVLYGQDLITELTGGGTTSYLIGQVLRVKVTGTETISVNGVARAQSADIEINNPNFTGYVQALHPTLNLKKGNITGGDLIFMDYDLDHADTDLNVTGDLTYLAGGGGSDVAAMITKLEAIGKKFRFIHNQGSTESDFGGILNYTGAVSNITNATNKVLVNKEYLELNYSKKSSAINFTPTITYADGTALTYTTLVTSNYSVASDVVTFNIEVSGVTSNHTDVGLKVTGLPAPLNQTTIVNCWLDLSNGNNSNPQGFYYKTGNVIQTSLTSTTNLTRFIISGSYIKQ